MDFTNGQLPISGFDHVAIPTGDIDVSLAFYRRVLGAVAPYESDFRSGRSPVIRIEMGGAVFNLHPVPSGAAPLIAEQATVGSADICLRWDQPISTAVAHLRARDVDIVVGPAPRKSSVGTMGQSVYFRDPDGNLLELLSITEAKG